MEVLAKGQATQKITPSPVQVEKQTEKVLRTGLESELKVKVTMSGLFLAGSGERGDTVLPPCNQILGQPTFQ